MSNLTSQTLKPRIELNDAEKHLQKRLPLLAFEFKGDRFHVSHNGTSENFERGKPLWEYLLLGSGKEATINGSDKS